MTSGFKLWLENEALDAYLKQNSAVSSVFTTLLKNRQIQEIIQDLDNGNQIMDRRKEAVGLLVIGSHRIPIRILELNISNVLVQKLDKSPFHEIADRWPIYPVEGDRSIVQLPSRVKIVANNNAINFVKLIAKYLAEKDITVGSEQFNNFLVMTKPMISTYGHNPETIQNLIDKSEIEFGDFTMARNKMSRNLKDDSSGYTREGAKDIDSDDILEDVLNFSDGVAWCKTEKLPDTFFLRDENNNFFMQIHIDKDNNIVDYNLVNKSLEDRNVIKQYLKQLLINDSLIRQCQVHSVFPGFGFSDQEVIEMIAENSYLRPSNKVSFMLYQIMKGGESKNKAIKELYEKVPEIKPFNVIDASLQHDCFITDLGDKVYFNTNNFIKELNNSHTRNYDFDLINAIIEGPSDVRIMVAKIFQEMQKKDKKFADYARMGGPGIGIYNNIVEEVMNNPEDYNSVKMLWELLEQFLLDKSYFRQFFIDWRKRIIFESKVPAYVNQLEEGSTLFSNRKIVFVKIKNNYLHYNLAISTYQVEEAIDEKEHENYEGKPQSLIGLSRLATKNPKEQSDLLKFGTVFQSFGTSDMKSFDATKMQKMLFFDKENYSISVRNNLLKQFLLHLWHELHGDPVE